MYNIICIIFFGYNTKSIDKFETQILKTIELLIISFSISYHMER